MDIRREDKKVRFIPVIITLETPEELEHMKYIFNVSRSSSLEDSMKASGLSTIVRQDLVTFDHKVHKAIGNM